MSTVLLRSPAALALASFAASAGARLLFAISTLAAVGRLAQACPSKPFRYVVPFPAGSTTDQTARFLDPPSVDFAAGARHRPLAIRRGAWPKRFGALS